MNYFYVSAYSEYGDWAFHVYTDDKTKIPHLIEQADYKVTVHAINGPFLAGHRPVECIKQPE